MSNERYIEFNSTYRNRARWPDPAEFEIPFSGSGRKGRLDALDPVSFAAPVNLWTSNYFNTTGAGSATVTGNVRNTFAVIPGPLSDQKTFVIEAAAGNTFQKLDDYYVGAVVQDTTNGEERRIIAYEYIGVGAGNDLVQVTVDKEFSGNFATGDTVNIIDPTQVNIDDGSGAFTNPYFFVPAGRLGENAYSTYIIYNETNREYRPVLDYDSVTHILRIDTSGSAVSTTTSGPITTWTNTDNYSIRKQPPLRFTANLTVAAGTTTSSIVLAGGPPSTVDDIYNHQFIRILPPTVGVTQYNYTVMNSDNPPAPLNEMRRIVDYDGATLTATVTPPFTVVPAVGDVVEILDFSYDNLNPLSYSGSMVSQQQQVCYEIELLDLILPNKTLSSGQGSRIAFYPYVYVEIANVSAPGAGSIDAIYSNNPNATRMVFRAAIDDVVNPLISAFVKIDGDGMVQTLKFKPNDNLKFSVRLPNGELYRTKIQDTVSPNEPDLGLQISAMFSIKRLG